MVYAIVGNFGSEIRAEVRHSHIVKLYTSRLICSEVLNKYASLQTTS
jgi:hypothetical protein